MNKPFPDLLEVTVPAWQADEMVRHIIDMDVHFVAEEEDEYSWYIAGDNLPMLMAMLEMITEANDIWARFRICKEYDVMRLKKAVL